MIGERLTGNFLMKNLQYPTGWRDSLGFKLLNHDGLMTPVLVREFGPLRAVQLAYEQTSTNYRRTSEIFQSASNLLVLNATLNINKASLSMEAVDSLMTTEILFGQLLGEQGIEVSLVGGTIFKRLDGRFGRRTDMYIKGSATRLAQVEETLVSDLALSKMAIGAAVKPKLF